MRFVIQRVREAAVRVEGEIIGQIQQGYLVLAGYSRTDQQKDADRLVRKLLGLRIFEDGEGKTNLSLRDVGGSLLFVSQFTLYADCKRGNRPSFTGAADPEQANALYDYTISLLRPQVPDLATGRFGAHMEVSLVNDGPFTLLLDTERL